MKKTEKRGKKSFHNGGNRNLNIQEIPVTEK